MKMMRVVMRDPDISAGAKGLYAYLLAESGGRGEATPNRETILQEFNVSVNTFSKYQRELLEAGYIEVTQARENKRFSYNVYTFPREGGRAG